MPSRGKGLRMRWRSWSTGRRAMVPFLSVPNVLDAVVVRGALASALATPDLVIEIPHGATKIDDTESHSGLPVPYPISRILIATPEAGCVAVDVYFTKDDGTAPPTPTATTGCVTAH